MKLIPEEIIRSKRDGQQLETEQIAAFVRGITEGTVGDEQIAAMAMAIWFQGLEPRELRDLTLAIRDSGTVLQWPDLPGPVLDKHSTGGVGDMVSFLVGPIVAACGGFVPMISGRGLGHTGGTLDKLESFPGINVLPGLDQFQDWVRKLGIAIVGQTDQLAPADRRIYAVRDSTSTVANRSLIISSILGKKLSEGLDGLVMDIKVGSGAFMSAASDGQQLAEELCGVAASAQLPTVAVISDMDQPLACTAGNALEMREAIDYLAGDFRHPRLHAVSVRIASEMLWVGKLADSLEDAEKKVLAALESGAAAERFEKMVAGQGGPSVPFERLAQHLPEAPLVKPVYPGETGAISSVDTRALGLAVVVLGGGRKRAGQGIDHAVGLAELVSVGDEVSSERPLAVIHANSQSAWDEASQVVRAAYQVGQAGQQPGDNVILGRHP